MRHSAGLRWAILSLLALGSVLGCTSPAAAGKVLTNREIIKSFERIVFSEELDVWTDPRVTKWTKPILIGVGGDQHQNYLNFLSAKVNELVGLTGHPIKLAPPERANTLVVFTPSVVDDLGTRHRALFGDLYGQDPTLIDQKIAQLRNSDTICYFGSAIGPESPFTIEFARVFISVNIPQQKIYHCILEELTQMMGLFNDSFLARHSIFNDFNNRDLSLPEHDQALLRILYDSRIKPGMTKEEALPVAWQILREFRDQPRTPSDLSSKDAQLVELDDLLTSGEITADEYLKRRAQIVGGGS